MKNLLLAMLLMPLFGYAQDDYSLTEKVKSVLGFTMPTISVDELNEMEAVHLLDAREYNEYQISHLPKARYVGDKDFKLSATGDISKTDTIVVYCTVGYRSEKIAEKLKKAGYENVFNLFGGIFSWKNSGNPVVDNENQETQKVHCYNKMWSVFLLEGEKVY
jgi:rhodanese-related sulfurtransferase